MMRWLLLWAVLLVSACGGGGSGGGESPRPLVVAAAVVAPEAVGEKIFHETLLSASGKLSCASCHVPDKFHGPGNSLAVQLGGISGTVAGLRAVPSLRYLAFSPGFGHEVLDDGGIIWTGGFNRDGRSHTIQQQALGVLFSGREMANGSSQELVNRVRVATWYPELLAAFPGVEPGNPDSVVDAITLSLEKYIKLDPDFAPFDSKFDAVQAGSTTFTVQELRGLALFNNPEKGNCAFCHPSTPKSGLPILFTDFGYDNLGVPRNRGIADNSSSTFFDLGACGPLRKDWFAADTGNCGKFKAPSLRNVAARPVFFHNGQFTDLRDVVKFYVTRDTHPGLWYPLGTDGTPVIYNDLPDAYKSNVNQVDAPYDRKLGDAPRLSDSEIDDVVVFLRTLTDGYTTTTTVTPAALRSR